ncbi:MAG: guanylate kinase [Bdellovibrionales bacterium]|nr:guanylate kinase [Bdellovibrionales bacterium]
MNKTKLLLIIGPTAVGKSSIIEKALDDYPSLVDLITYTTRGMRAGEFEGNPYHFVSEEKFRELMAKDFFLETANVHGKLYGTPKDQLERATAEGKCVIADIDVQGSKKLLTLYPDAVTIFLMPPSIEALRERFIKRGITSEADLAKRLESAQREIAQAQDFKHVVINDRLDSAYASICKIIDNLLA